MVVLDFLKSLVMPRKMQKYRYMSILIAICLFVCSTYLLLIPTRYYYNHKKSELVEENNLAYLQSIKNIPTVGEEITLYVNEIKNKECYASDNQLNCNKLGVFSIELADNINNLVGYVTKNTEENYWYFNGQKTDVAIASETNNKPSITTVDNGIVIESVTDKAVTVEGINSSDTIDCVLITVTDKGKLKINEVVYETLIVSQELDLDIDENNKLICNGVTTDYACENKCVFYFIPQAVTYYEKDFQYVGEDNYKKNIKFIIDLSVSYTQEVPYTIDNYPNADIENEEYYFVIFNKSGLYYQSHLKGIDDKKIDHNDGALLCNAFNTNYSDIEVDFSTITVSTFPQTILGFLESGYASMAISNTSFIALLYLVVFTLIVALLFSLLFKKNGKMKTFKEYYNIASLANIVPLLITFVFMWFNPGWFGTVYLISFSLYYLFVLYRINNSPEMV